MATLVLYLKLKGACTGPLAKHTSHSGMGNNLTLIVGEKLMEGFQEFLVFGNALHNKFANIESPAGDTLPLPQKIALIKSATALDKHPVVKVLTRDADREQKLYTELNGVKIAYILDVHQRRKRIGSDLKTTACNTLEEIVESCRKYGYFRQAQTYIKAEKLKKFYFIFINKTTYKITVLDVDDYAEDMAYAEKELAFTLYFYKHYGKAHYTKGKAEQLEATPAPVAPPAKAVRSGKKKASPGRKGVRR